MICPHGDAACGCVDAGPVACRYEGPIRWPCPNPPTAGRPGDLDPAALRHCHVEACPFHGRDRDCGIVRIDGTTTLQTALDLGCGLIRDMIACAPNPPFRDSASPAG